MANTFLQLPASAANGAGTAVDVSTMGRYKTIVVAGSWTLTPNITIEVNNSAAQDGPWQALQTFQGGGMMTFEVAARYMRARVSDFKGGDAPVVYVGSTDDGAEFAELVATAATGLGAAVDVSTLGLFKSVQVSGTFRGVTVIEVSNDGGATWGQVMSFQTPGLQSAIVAADFMRVRRVGVPAAAPGLPIINIGAANVSSGSVIVEDEGVVLGTFSTLNFTGGGITATDAGGGVADVEVTDTNQVFRYTADGTEANPFTVSLPVARSNTTYNVQITQGGPAANAIKIIRALTETFTVNDFQIESSAALQDGDVIQFTVEDRDVVIEI